MAWRREGGYGGTVLSLTSAPPHTDGVSVEFYSRRMKFATGFEQKDRCRQITMELDEGKLGEALRRVVRIAQSLVTHRLARARPEGMAQVREVSCASAVDKSGEE